MLEIGFGTGLNLPHYFEQFRRITAVDPSRAMHRLAQGRIGKTGIQLNQWVLGSERLAGATLDRLTHRCHILGAGGESYRLKDAKGRRAKCSNGSSCRSK